MLKKTLAALCILALLLSGAAAFAAVGWTVKTPEESAEARGGAFGLGPLFDRNGLSLKITSISYRDGAEPILRFDVWVENESGGTLNLHFDDVYLDGTQVQGIGIYNLASGSAIAEYFFFEPFAGQGADVLRDPMELSFKIRVAFDSTGADFFTQECRMSGPLAIATATAYPTVRPTARPTVAPDYPWLEKGDEGSDVRRLQLALISLGYLSGSADGVYGKQTARAVYDFREQNGLLIGVYDDEASPEVQERLFGGSAQPYAEPSFSLELFTGSNGQWENLSGDKLKMRVQVRNVAKHRTVKAFELYMYATDIWGERIYGENQVYYRTTTKNVGPGKTVYSDYMVIPNRSQIDKVYVGISKIVYSNGYVEEASSVEYWNWEIR
ncbi:MAG: peptidoglycan-binding protein [Clostridiales bacterium]|nr:peptidoglycan-binding protein [Clostridiales bacterium]